MKILFLAGVLLVLTSMALMAGEKPAGASKLLHVVSLKFKSSAAPEQIQKVVDAFRELKTKVPGIHDLEWGVNVSPEKHDKGFTHGFVLSFQSEKDRDGYLVHPEHKAFGRLLGPIMEDVFVLDYWAQK